MSEIPKWIREKRDAAIKAATWNGPLQCHGYHIGFNAAAQIMLAREKIAVDALEFYAKLPLSEKDQMWTQELADQCIKIATKALEKLKEK